MKVEYKTIKTYYKDGPPGLEYRLLNNPSCCKEMEEIMNDDTGPVGFDRDTAKFGMRTPSYDGDYYNGYYYPISFCPFCKEPIILEEKEVYERRSKEITETVKRHTYTEVKVK